MSFVSPVQRWRYHAQAYYFRKLARYLQPTEYRRVKRIRSQTGPQISIPELLYLRWGIRTFKPQVVVEIGSFNGASTSLIADQLRQLGSGRIHAIDLFSKSAPMSGFGSAYWKLFDQTMHPYLGWFEKIEGDAKTILWNRPIDFLFIDGDHSEAGVSADIQKYAAFVQPGGCVFLHDYLDSPETNSMVKSVVDRMLMRDSAYRKLGQVNSLIGFRKVRTDYLGLVGGGSRRVSPGIVSK